MAGFFHVRGRTGRREVGRSEFAKIVEHPGRSAMNTGLSPCRASTLRQLLGEPRPQQDYSEVCKAPTGPVRLRMTTARVGPIRVTGLSVAVESLQRAFEAFGRAEPAAFEAVGSAGMLCVRFVRGSNRTLSNHSWGTAIDLTWGGELQPLGSQGVQAGALKLYRFMRAEGWYWGAGFARNDPMHWELAEETVKRMIAG
jgi:hypothetical protein